MTVNTVLARQWLPLEAGRSQHPLTNIWMPHAVTDPLLFLATLNYAAAHLDAVHGRQSNPRTIAQKGQIIRLINMRLQDSAETVSNTTIGAVAMFAAMEVCDPYSDIFSRVAFHKLSFASFWTQPDDLATISP